MTEHTPAELREMGERTRSTSYRPSLTLARGAGMALWDADGNEYLDFLAGIAVNCLGNCHPGVVAAIQRQAAELMQISNAFYSPVQVRVQQRLVDLSFADRTFFCNSGAEANEAAIKLARRYQRIAKGEDRTEIVTFGGSFHGRTLATVTATAQPKYHKGFEPLPTGFVTANFNDLESVRAVVGQQTVAIMVEPVQGEGGVRPATQAFMDGLREVADASGALLIFDEVQTGIGRTGKLFAYEHYSVEPDIMSLAKGLGGGVAIGCMLATEKVFEGFAYGSHATTFGGNPLACAAAEVVLDEVSKPEFLAAVRETGDYLQGKLREANTALPFADVRGLGLMVGAEMGDVAGKVVVEARSRGLLFNTAGGKALRFVPPLIASKADVDAAVAIVIEAIDAVAGNQA